MKPNNFNKARQLSKESNPKNDKTDKKREFKKSTNSRLKRSELIAQKEKIKMTHKFNKMMRKENKQNNHTLKLTNPLRKNAESIKSKQTKFEITKKGEDKINGKDLNIEESGESKEQEIKKNPKIFTSYKKAQIEFENKQKQKQIEKEVSLNFCYKVSQS
jgi:hypothetical protein